MKLRQNYTNLHLAELTVALQQSYQYYNTHICSCTVQTTIWRLLTNCAIKREEQNLYARIFFSVWALQNGHRLHRYRNCSPWFNEWLEIDLLDIQGNELLQDTDWGCANAVNTHVSKLFPGSTSNKAIVEKSGVLEHFRPGDLILADKGFLMADIVPTSVSVLNIPPVNESKVKQTNTIARGRIHVERANARLKDFKILTFILPYLRCYAEKVLCWIGKLTKLLHQRN